NDVGDEVLRQAHSLITLARLPYDLDVVLGVEQRPEPGAHERLVVGQQDADHDSFCTGSRARTRNPPPGRGPASSSPPRTAARSRMPGMPLPPPGMVAAGLLRPRPSSSISTVTSSSP